MSSQSPYIRVRPSLIGLALFCFGAFGTGCSTAAAPGSPIGITPRTIQGRVHGGQQPVVGAQIQLYAAGSPTDGSGDYGVGATPLISGELPITDANGVFSITGTYELPPTPSFLYIVANGGSPGNGSPANPNIVLMATIGGCFATSVLSPSLFIDINEVTTIAAVTALQSFMEAPSSGNVGTPHFGAPSFNYNDLRTAFASAANMVARAKVANLAQPDSVGLRINTLADILAFCVNSDPGISVNCAILYGEATGVAVPADTIQAAWNIAQDPTNAAQLFSLVPPSPPFVALPAAPVDFDVSPPPTAGVACLAVLANTTITNSGLTTISGGDVALSGGSSITGFPLGVITPPAAQHISDAVAQNASDDWLNAYFYLTAQPSTVEPPFGAITVLPPGTYRLSTVLLNGELVLDGGGDPNAVFIFLVGSTLTAASNSVVSLSNGAKSANVFWEVGSAATIGQNAQFVGTIIAIQAITLNNGAQLQGRALSFEAAVTLDTSNITAP